MYSPPLPPLLAWQFRWGQVFHSRQKPPGGGQNTSIQGPVSYPKNPLAIAGNNFPRDNVDTPPKWPSQIPFLSPSTLVSLCTKQSLLPAYSRLLWVPAPSSPFQGVDQAPSSTLPGGFLLTWALSSPSAVHYLLMWKVWELRSRILPEEWGAFPPLEDSSRKALE